MDYLAPMDCFMYLFIGVCLGVLVVSYTGIGLILHGGGLW